MLNLVSPFINFTTIDVQGINTNNSSSQLSALIFCGAEPHLISRFTSSVFNLFSFLMPPTKQSTSRQKCVSMQIYLFLWQFFRRYTYIICCEEIINLGGILLYSRNVWIELYNHVVIFLLLFIFLILMCFLDITSRKNVGHQTIYSAMKFNWYNRTFLDSCFLNFD